MNKIIMNCYFCLDNGHFTTGEKMLNKNKILYLFIQKCLLGFFACVGGILLMIVPHYDKETLSAFFPAIIVTMTGVIIAIVLYSDRIRKRFHYNDDDINIMHTVDSQILSKLGWLAILIFASPYYGIPLENKGVYIQGILLTVFGLVCIIQFIGYYIKLRYNKRD